MAATLEQINTAIADPALKERTRSALIKAAKDVAFESTETGNHANRLKWAKAVLRDPDGHADDMWRFVVGAVSSRELGDASTGGTILGISDADIQDNVALGINIFADGT